MLALFMQMKSDIYDKNEFKAKIMGNCRQNFRDYFFPSYLADCN